MSLKKKCPLIKLEVKKANQFADAPPVGAQG